MKKHDGDNRFQKYVVWIFFMKIGLYLIKLEKPEKRKPYYLRLHHTMYHEKFEIHQFTSQQNCN